MKKVCTVCNLEKNIEDYHRKKNTKDGYRSNCKECSSKYNISRREKSKEYNKKYQEENKEKIRENKKKYYLENIEYFEEKNKEIRLKLDPEKKSEYGKRYYNKPETKDKIKKYRKEKSERDSIYKLKINIRKRISQSLKTNSIKKTTKCESILGCSYSEFREYIESLFTEGMNWKNHGDWHLDHKTPISWANTEEEVYKLNHFTNFQPLWKEQNLSKGNRYEDL